MDPDVSPESELEDLGLLERHGTVLRGEERTARIELLTSLQRDGVGLAELRRAVEQDRLVLLPLERALRGDAQPVSLTAASAEVGLEPEALQRLRSTLGLASIEPDDAVIGPAEVDAYRRAALAMEAGMPLDGILEINAALAASMPQLAATLRQLATTAMVSSDDELTAALDLAASARSLLPLLMPVLEFALQAHLEQQVVADFVDNGLDRETTSARSVAFADLTGFTELSEQEPGDAAGGLSRHLTDLAARSRSARTRLVKSIGDAVMLTAPTPAELVESIVTLAAAARRDGLPALHVGLAHGDSVQHAGDLFGRSVNLASRLAGAAEPDELLCDRLAADLLADSGHDLVARGSMTFKGLDEPRPVWSLTLRS